MRLTKLELCAARLHTARTTKQDAVVHVLDAGVGSLDPLVRAWLTPTGNQSDSKFATLHGS
jgi:hypothetical protein